jgi:low affinity Fe/Cu permease
VIAMADGKDKYDNPLNNFMSHPAFFAGAIALAIVLTLLGYFDPWFLIIIIPVAAFGTWKWLEKRKAS